MTKKIVIMLIFLTKSERNIKKKNDINIILLPNKVDTLFNPSWKFVTDKEFKYSKLLLINILFSKIINWYIGQKREVRNSKIKYENNFWLKIL